MKVKKFNYLFNTNYQLKISKEEYYKIKVVEVITLLIFGTFVLT